MSGIAGFLIRSGENWLAVTVSVSCNSTSEARETWIMRDRISMFSLILFGFDSSFSRRCVPKSKFSRLGELGIDGVKCFLNSFIIYFGDLMFLTVRAPETFAAASFSCAYGSRLKPVISYVGSPTQYLLTLLSSGLIAWPGTSNGVILHLLEFSFI